MRVAWIAGGPCWLKACRNESSSRSEAPEGGDVRQTPAGTPTRATKRNPTTQADVHLISVQDPVLVHRSPAVSNIYNKNYKRSSGSV